MGNKQKTRVDTSGIVDPFGHNPFGSFPFSGFPVPRAGAESSFESIGSDPESFTPMGLLLRVRREKKGRAGKTVTVVYGTDSLPLENASEILAKLKKALACGGSIEDGSLILQGDQPDRVCEMLKKQGFHPIRAGG